MGEVKVCCVISSYGSYENEKTIQKCRYRRSCKCKYRDWRRRRSKRSNVFSYYEEAKEIPSEEIILKYDLKKLTELEILHAISENQLSEFIWLANSKFDLSLFKEFFLIERTPVGYYYFEYEVIGEDGEGDVKTCTVLVYDWMKDKFDELFDWLKNHTNKEIFDIEAAADEIDERIFGERAKRLGYDKENIRDILRFSVQNECKLPQFIEFEKRAEYYLSPLVQYLADKDFI